MGSQSPSDIHLLQNGSSPVDLHGLQGPSPWSAQRLQGNPCSSAWSTSCHSFFAGLCVCRAVFHSYSHSFFPDSNCCTVTFPPFFNIFISFSDRDLALTTNSPVLGLPAVSHTRHLFNPPATFPCLPNTDSSLRRAEMW